MNLHPIVIREAIKQTTEAASFGRRRKHGRAIWSVLLVLFALFYFAARMAV